MKISILISLATLIVGVLVGILISSALYPQPQLQAFPEDSAWRKESIRIVGSTTVLPIGSECAKAFMKKYETVKITVEGGGSGRGYKELIDGVCQIGMASRFPKEKELKLAKEKGVSLVLHEIAVDAIAIIVHPSVVEGLGGEPLKLTLEEVGRIFAGEYTRWSEIDPRLPDEEIVVFTREHGSGTRDTFEKFCLKPFGLKLKSEASEVPSNPTMRASVEKTHYSIGYIGLGFLKEGVIAVHLARKEGQVYYEPTRENAIAGVYPIVRYLYLVTSGIPKSGSLVDRFIDFVKSPEGQSIVEKCGFIAMYPKRGD
ncbi:MAG: phosphate ABC transporter substrate-binding protein [Thermoprotei archaeon]|nr:MAG: phosphate ABC transporter substrate-binding protein [Thermoprotei archaeon]